MENIINYGKYKKVLRKFYKIRLLECGIVNISKYSG